MKTLNKKNIFFLFTILLLTGSCKRFVEVPAPVTSTNAYNVYTSDATAAAVLNGIYAKLMQVNYPGGGLISTDLFTALSADELSVFNLTSQVLSVASVIGPYYTNGLNNNNTGSTDFWNNIYPVIFVANSAIEGLNNSKALTPAVKRQLTGEAKFVRAFCYFYLVNLYGDVPLALSSDYQVNRLLSRSPKATVYQQIVSDLAEAKDLLVTGYIGADITTASTERVSPNKWAASAMLARTYLFTGDYKNAEAEATAVINTSLYDTVPVSNVFLKNSKEAIWQLQPVRSDITNTPGARLYVLPATGPNTTGQYPVYLSNNIVNSFETGDRRKTSWTNPITIGGVTYYGFNKYKVDALNSPVTEYLMVLRLAEQYLIRAEARAQQGDLVGAAADLNLIRKRAGLLPTTAAGQAGLIAAILQERKVELFVEWGHRWLDLKRTGTVDAVMSQVTSQKGGSWNTNWQLYPIPLTELNFNPSLVGHQNPGY